MEREGQIIRSVLDTDLYKITMGQAVFRHYDNQLVGYEFINRGKTPFPEGFKGKLEDQIAMMADLKMTSEEREFLEKRCGHYLRPGFIDWLSNYQFNPDEVKVEQNEGELKVNIDGPWYRTIYWEVPLMALISELYFNESNQQPTIDWEARARLTGTKLRDADVKFADFGTRRRYSQAVHERIIQILMEAAQGSFAGTSNVDLARRYGLTPIGTFAHEWVMAHAGMFGNVMATSKALEVWANEFEGNLGIALTDTFGTDVFLKDFNAYYAKLFDGLRGDSGDPKEDVDKFYNQYKKFGINPMSKLGVFADSLNDDKAIDLRRYMEGKLNPFMGIGTFLTNNVGVVPLNMVIKLFYIMNSKSDREINVCKLSNDITKASGDPRAIEAAKYDFGLEIVK